MINILPALPAHVRGIAELIEPMVAQRLLISKDLIDYFEDVQEFYVAIDGDRVVGCGALHVLWEDIAEIRTLAVSTDYQGQGVGGNLYLALEAKAYELELRRLFCLTFETSFFGKFGFTEIRGTPVGENVYAEMLRSHDDGMAEFLELARVKPNTLGNTRMLKELDNPISEGGFQS